MMYHKKNMAGLANTECIAPCMLKILSDTQEEPTTPYGFAKPTGNAFYLWFQSFPLMSIRSAFQLMHHHQNRSRNLTQIPIPHGSRNQTWILTHQSPHRTVYAFWSGYEFESSLTSTFFCFPGAPQINRRFFRILNTGSFGNNQTIRKTDDHPLTV